MRIRNNRGQFVAAVDEGVNIIVTIYKLIPLLIFFFLVYKYFNLTDIILKILLEIVCGKECHCDCKEKKSSWS